MSSTRRSTVWNHFTDTEIIGKVKCKFCLKLIAISANSTGNLFRHLKQHPGVSTTRAVNPQCTAATLTSATTPQESAPTGSALAVPDLTQPSVSTYFIKPLSNKKTVEIDHQLVKMITKEYHPFSLVEDVEFKKLMHMLCPSYNLPTRKTLATSLIPAQYNILRDRVKARVGRAFAVCITADGWTSRGNDCFIAMTAHYIVEVESSNTIKMASDLLGCISMPERHTAQNLFVKMKQVIDDHDLGQRVAGVVTDNAHNMTAALRIGGWRFWGCFAHSLNLIVQAGIKEIDHTLKKARAIVTFFRRSAHASAQLRTSQVTRGDSVLKLKIDVPTRWNSTMLMLQRLVANKLPILSALAVINAGTLASSADLEAITNAEWIVIEQTIELLEIFEAITQVVSSQNTVTASTVIVLHRQISKHLAESLLRPELMPAAEKVASRLQTECASRFDKLEDNEMMAQCTILDPRFKKLGFINSSKYAKALSSLVTKVSRVNLNSDAVRGTSAVPVPTIDHRPESSSSLGRRELMVWKDFDDEAKKHQRPENLTASAIVEVNQYLDEPYLPRQEDPLVWWHQRRNVYPRLYQTMKTRLCMLATSVPCERIFSKAGQIVTEKRTRLSTKKVEEVVFLAYNLGNVDD